MSLADLRATTAALRTAAVTQRVGVETAAATSPAASADRAGALATWQATRDQLQNAIGGLTGHEAVAGLSGQLPLVLLPVRLETRFSPTDTDVVQVRVFPDDLHVDGHIPELTTAELARGQALWAAPDDLPVSGETADPSVAAGAVDGRRALWSAMVTTFGDRRAAWIAHATRPITAADGTQESPAPATVSDAYVRPAVARALPDRWYVRCYVAGNVVADAWTLPVRSDLHLTPDPSLPADTDGTLPAIDSELQWTVDYTAAVNAGMAVNLRLPAGTARVDRIVAVGLRASDDPKTTQAELDGLLAAHAWSDGLGVLGVGTPTSNAPDVRSGIDRNPDPVAVWSTVFGQADATSTAGHRIETALGLTPGSLDGIEGISSADDADAEAMQTLLWAATWGYYLTAMLDGSQVPNLPVDAIRRHYLDFVRGRGTLPTLRAGREPYGLLPVLPLGNWTPGGAAPVVDGLARLLQRIRPLWSYGVGSPLTAQEGPGFDDAFSAVMRTDAVARAGRVRTAVADRTVDPLLFSGVSVSSVAVHDAMLAPLLALPANPLVLSLFSPDSEPVRAPFVVDPTDPDPDATVHAALAGLRAVNPVLAIASSLWLKPRPDGPATVLHTLARRSLLLEYGNAGTWLTRLQVNAKPQTLTTFSTGRRMGPQAVPAAAAPAATFTPSAQWTVAQAPQGLLVGLTPAAGGGFAAATTMPSLLSAPFATITGSTAVGEWLWRNPAQFVDVRQSLDQTLAALDHLGAVPADDLGILLGEVLDLASHRWSAWAESVAASELSRRRAAGAFGAVVGGWGVVEGLSRAARTTGALPDSLANDAGLAGRTVQEDVHAGGFVHAPSPAQAATAAVLRAAHLAHGGDADPAFATDLSSRAARDAVRLADGVRGGQPLGALLGYEVERGLHDADADRLIAPLRAFAPQWQASGTFVEGAPTEVVSPSAVVDGLALVRAGADAVVAAVAPGPLEAMLRAVLATAAAHADNLADLLTAEGVHQSLLGNATRAGAAFDAAHRGGLPPDSYDVLRTPRRGAALTCRVGVLLDASDAAVTAPLAGGWTSGPREAADPVLARWLAAVLPPVARVRVRLAKGDSALPAIGPVALVVDRAEALRARVMLALGEAPQAGRDPSWSATTVGLDELLTVAADLRDVIGRRGLRDADLAPPSTPTAATDERDTADLARRMTAAAKAVAAAQDALTTAGAPLADAPLATVDPAVATAALLAAVDVGVTVIPRDVSLAELALAVGSALTETTRRTALPVPVAVDGADALVAGLKAWLGPATPALARFTPSDPAGYAARLTAGATVSPDAIEEFLEASAVARVPLSRCVTALEGCEALMYPAAPAGGWSVLEHADAGDGGWTASRTATQLATAGAVVTTVLHTAGGSMPATVAGVVVDDWTEVVPGDTAATTVAFEADTPTARAPQCVLVGLHPDPSATWNEDLLCAVALEALDWARIRTVTPDAVAWIGRMLPALLLPDGDATDVIAAPPWSLLEVDASLLAATAAIGKRFG